MLGKTHRVGGIAFGGVTAVALEQSLHMGMQDPILSAVVLMAGGAVGSLVPDLDSKNSILSQKLKIVSSLVRDVATHRGFTHTLVGLSFFTLLSALIVFVSDYILLSDSIILKGLFGILVGVICHLSVQFILASLKKVGMLKLKKVVRLNILVASFIVPFLITVFYSYELLPYITFYLIGCVVGYLSHMVYDMLTVSGVPLLAPFTSHSFRIARFRTGKPFFYKSEDQRGRGIDKPLSWLSVIVSLSCLVYIIYLFR